MLFDAERWHKLTHLDRSRSPWRRFGALAPALLVAGAWSIGAVLFLRADGSFSWSLPRTARPVDGEHNLAAYELGPTLRASSYYRAVLTQHHPVFLVDGRKLPSLVEKWASSAADRTPWIELRWRERRLLTRVQIWHAGLLESEELTIRNYRLRCLSDAPAPAALAVRDNRRSVALHELRCPRALGLRIDWEPNEGSDGLVRVYEVEAWGR